MLFVDWGEVRIGIAAVLLMIAVFGLVRWSQRKRKVFKVFTWVTSIPMGALSVLLTLFLLMDQGCETAHPAVYSPDHASAVRVLDWDVGATGGGTSVRVYTDHGFVTNRVYAGGWQSVDGRSVRWLDNRSLEIYYDPSFREHECVSSSQIQVICTPNSR
jgi:hypothetical protein